MPNPTNTGIEAAAEIVSTKRRKRASDTTKRYLITVSGFDPEPFFGKTASAARWQAFKALREAGYRCEFRAFLSKTTTLHLGIEHGDPRTPKYGVAL